MVTKMAFSIGNIGEYIDGIETWKSYTERVTQFFKANDVKNEKRVPALLSLMGGKTYGLLRNLTSPNELSTKSVDDIITLLNTHLSPKPLVIAERFRFLNCDQTDGETKSVYVSELRRLSEHCEFGATLND